MIYIGYYLLIIISTILGALGMFLFKRVSDGRSLHLLALEWRFWFGLSLSGLSLIPYFFALRHLPLTIVYPAVSLTYVWTLLLSVKYLKEHVTLPKLLGLTGIFIGVFLIGLGS